MAPFLVSETLRVLWTKAAVMQPLGVAAGVTLWLPAEARGCPPTPPRCHGVAPLP